MQYTCNPTGKDVGTAEEILRVLPNGSMISAALPANVLWGLRDAIAAALVAQRVAQWEEDKRALMDVLSRRRLETFPPDGVQVSVGPLSVA